MPDDQRRLTRGVAIDDVRGASAFDSNINGTTRAP
jgi:hypothetical protein